LKPLTETALVAQLKQYLELAGALVIRVNSGAFAGSHNGKKWFVKLNSEPGCSDLLACYRGRFVALEVKRPGKKATPEQESFLAAVEAAGGLAAVVTGIEDVQQLLDCVQVERLERPMANGSPGNQGSPDAEFQLGKGKA
jgi:hypothetical protein